MTARRVLPMVLGAVGSLAVIALLFGNQWFFQWWEEVDFDNDNPTGAVVAWLMAPAWRIGDRAPFYQQFIDDLALVLMLGLLALAVLLGGRTLDSRRGGFGAFAVGWWGTVVAVGLGVFVGRVLKIMFNDASSGEAFAVGGLAYGAAFGLVYGWIIGLGALLGYLLGRPKPGTAGPGSVPPQGMQPASAPYAPPSQGGWAPARPSPAAGPSGGFPLPQVPPAGLAPAAPRGAGGVPQPPPPPPGVLPGSLPPGPAAVADDSDAVALAEPAQPAQPAQPASPEPVASPAESPEAVEEPEVVPEPESDPETKPEPEPEPEADVEPEPEPEGSGNGTVLPGDPVDDVPAEKEGPQPPKD